MHANSPETLLSPDLHTSRCVGGLLGTADDIGETRRLQNDYRPTGKRGIRRWRSVHQQHRHMDGADHPGRRASRRSASGARSEEHTSELQSLMRISYAVFCLKKKNKTTTQHNTHTVQAQNIK